MWMKRLSFTMCVQCPCERICEPHKKEGCTEESCVHFLNLDECLANKVCSKFDFFLLHICLSFCIQTETVQDFKYFMYVYFLAVD